MPSSERGLSAGRERGGLGDTDDSGDAVVDGRGSDDRHVGNGVDCRLTTKLDAHFGRPAPEADMPTKKVTVQERISTGNVTARPRTVGGRIILA